MLDHPTITKMVSTTTTTTYELSEKDLVTILRNYFGLGSKVEVTFNISSQGFLSEPAVTITDTVEEFQA